MWVKPPVVVKQCGDAEAGELIRLQYGEGTTLALVAIAKTDKPGESERRFLILLERVDGRGASPRFVDLGPGDDASVLSHGTEYNFHFDPSDAASIDIGGNRLYQANGAIVLSRGSALLRVSPLDLARYHGPLHYEIATGLIVRAPTNPDRVLIGKWEIRLAGEPQAAPVPSPPLMQFAVE